MGQEPKKENIDLKILMTNEKIIYLLQPFTELGSRSKGWIY
jgi:hypothetical protein